MIFGKHIEEYILQVRNNYLNKKDEHIQWEKSGNTFTLMCRNIPRAFICKMSESDLIVSIVGLDAFGVSAYDNWETAIIAAEVIVKYNSIDALEEFLEYSNGKADIDRFFAIHREIARLILDGFWKTVAQFADDIKEEVKKVENYERSNSDD